MPVVLCPDLCTSDGKAVPLPYLVVHCHLPLIVPPQRIHILPTPPPLSRSVPHTANLCTKILDFRGFDSSIILIVRGGILMSIGNLPLVFESSNLSREILRY